jgi:threonine/homoserine/homoserine lactone efflux protein
MFLSLVNPKGYAAMAALFSGFTLVQGGLVLDGAAKLALLTVIIGAVDLGWLLAGAALTGLYRRPAFNRAINIVFALLLLASVGLAFAV